jgi:hypothetical protein
MFSNYYNYSCPDVPFLTLPPLPELIQESQITLPTSSEQSPPILPPLKLKEENSAFEPDCSSKNEPSRETAEPE